MIRRVVVVLFVIVMAASVSVAQTDASPAEKALLQMANQFRAENGVAPLTWNSELAHAARVHAKRVVSEPGELEHQYPGEADMITRASREGAHFAAIAENLAGRGQNPAELQQKWMSTPVHRANLLDPKMNVVGIGVIENGGLLYAVEDFAHSVPAPKREVIEGQVAEALQKAGLGSVKTSEAARSNCESQSNTAAGKARIQVSCRMCWCSESRRELITRLQWVPAQAHSPARDSPRIEWLFCCFESAWRTGRRDHRSDRRSAW